MGLIKEVFDEGIFIWFCRSSHYSFWGLIFKFWSLFDESWGNLRAWSNSFFRSSSQPGVFVLYFLLLSVCANCHLAYEPVGTEVPQAALPSVSVILTVLDLFQLGPVVTWTLLSNWDGHDTVTVDCRKSLISDFSCLHRCTGVCLWTKHLTLRNWRRHVNYW